jgi:hypothetical protein
VEPAGSRIVQERIIHSTDSFGLALLELLGGPETYPVALAVENLFTALVATAALAQRELALLPLLWKTNQGQEAHVK